jgi:hypothetical protein
MTHFVKQATPTGTWVRQLLTRAHPNVAVVALAAKLARIAWAVLRHGSSYGEQAVSVTCPMMRTRPSLHANPAARNACHQPLEASSGGFAPENRASFGINTMNMKHVFSQIDSDCSDRHVVFPTIWTQHPHCRS